MMMIRVIKKVLKTNKKAITTTTTTHKLQEHCDHTKLHE